MCYCLKIFAENIKYSAAASKERMHLFSEAIVTQKE